MSAAIARPRLSDSVRDALDRAPVTLLLGPRQCGKSTIARRYAADVQATYFDLEDPGTPLRAEVAMRVLEDLRGTVVIDEVQRVPELFALLRVLADRDPLPARFLLLGSASPDLVRGVSESLAGRVAFVDMSGFDLEEVGTARRDLLWIRGGFPDSFLAESDEESFLWRGDFTRTFLERDIPQLGIRVPAATLRRFWTMLAHHHGQVWNASEIARSLGTKGDTARRYLEILQGTFLVRSLPPWFENVSKRLVRSPKVYLRDSGILHTLLGLRTKLDVQSHPKLGHSWEGFALEEVVRLARADRDAYFYATHGGAELDLFLQRRGKRYGFEFKYSDAPKTTRSMHAVREDLGLDALWVIHPGSERYPLAEGIDALPLSLVSEVLRPVLSQL